MEKNSLLDKSSADSIRPYEMAEFDAPVSAERARRLHLQQVETDAFNKGFANGMSSGQGNVKTLSERLESIVLELEGFRARKTEELLPELIELSVEIAHKIILVNIEKDREIILGVVREAIKKLGSREDHITIRVNPSDYDTMLMGLPSLKEESRLRDVTVEPAANVSPGGCFIETPSGEVDARIEEQLKEIRDAISTAINS